MRLMQRHRVRGQRQLGAIEVAMAQHAKEGLFDRQRQEVELDALRLHHTALQRVGTVVVPAGERDPQLCHARASAYFGSPAALRAMGVQWSTSLRTKSVNARASSS